MEKAVLLWSKVTIMNFLSMKTLKTILNFLLIMGSLSLFGQEFSYNILTNPDVENSEAYQNGNAYQRDFLLFADMLENTHPIFAETDKPHYDMDSLISVGYQYLAGCENDNKLKQYLQSILSPLGDGHSTVMMDVTDKLYPFKFFVDGDTAFYLIGVTKDFSDELGHRITAINGRPVREVIDSFRPLMSCANDNHFMANVNNYMQWKATWDYNPYRWADDMLQLQFDDGNTILLSDVDKSELNVEWYYPKKKNVPFEYNKMPFSYNILPEKQLCYLRFSSCTDRNTLRMYEMYGMSVGMTEEQIAQVPDFGLFLHEMFSEMDRQGVKTLVIDVRDNGGGNSQLCDQLLSWLKPIEEIGEMSSVTRISKLWETQYPDMAMRYKGEFQKKGIAYRLGELYDLSILDDEESEESEMDKMIKQMYVMNHSSDSLFTGEVIFMQGEDTFSSAGILVTKAVDNGIGIVIGVNSVYTPSAYGDILTWELPNTHIQGFISHKIFVRPNASKKNESAIIPDIPLPKTWDDFCNGIDPCWKWVLEK